MELVFDRGLIGAIKTHQNAGFDRFDTAYQNPSKAIIRVPKASTAIKDLIDRTGFDARLIQFDVVLNQTFGTFDLLIQDRTGFDALSKLLIGLCQTVKPYQNDPNSYQT